MTHALNRTTYDWIEQSCPVCESRPTQRLGRRGGDAHRDGLGVACEVWKCRQCGLIFPDPMPQPRGVGRIERVGARVATAVSQLGELGTYIETWARRA